MTRKQAYNITFGLLYQFPYSNIIVTDDEENEQELVSIEQILDLQLEENERIESVKMWEEDNPTGRGKDTIIIKIIKVAFASANPNTNSFVSSDKVITQIQTNASGFKLG